MSEHYYVPEPQAGHAERTLEVHLRGESLKFFTDRGVFSRQQIDFGSRLLIETADIPEAASILDVGCGYGPIGLTLAKESPLRRVTLIDINRRAVDLAKKNAQLNGLSQVRVMASDLFEAVQGEQFDAVLTNPPVRAGKAVVYRLFEESVDHIAPGGMLWVVIQKKQGAPSALKKLESLFPAVEIVARKKGYHIFKAQQEI